MVTAAWNKPVSDAPATDARRIANAPGRLWATSEEGVNTIGPEGPLSDGFPTGYEAFCCMRYEVTQGQ